MAAPYREAAAATGVAPAGANLKLAWVAVLAFTVGAFGRIAGDAAVDTLEPSLWRSAIAWGSVVVYCVGLAGTAGAVVKSTPRCGPETAFRDMTLAQSAMLWTVGIGGPVWAHCGVVINSILAASLIAWNVIDLLGRTRALRRGARGVAHPVTVDSFR